MAVSRNLDFASLDELFLDPMNPRLGRHQMNRETPQESLLDIMRSWVLEELASSYLESGGFWTHEPLIAVAEPLYGDDRLVVVEGNRRLAALMFLMATVKGNPPSRKWVELLNGSDIPEGLFDRIPYVLADSRQDVQAFLGFRHVTGIKQWDADEKAGFIAQLVDEGGLSYRQISRKIGSNVPTVRKHYVAYRVLLQIEDNIAEFEPEKADKRFTILYMSLSTQGVQDYLNIDIRADIDASKHPVPEDHITHLSHFSRWLFGFGEIEPIITDTRMVSEFGRILESADAVEYLESKKQPNFEVAYRISGGNEQEIINYINEAKHNIELSLTQVHIFKKSKEVRKAVEIFGRDALQLLSIFPDIKKELFSEVE